MNVALDPVDTYLMISGKDPNAHDTLTFDIEFKLFIQRKARKKRKDTYHS